MEIRKNHRTMIQFSSASDNDFITIATYLLIMSERAPSRIQSNWEEWENTKSMFLLDLIFDSLQLNASLNLGQLNPRELSRGPVDTLSSLVTDPTNYRVNFALPFR